MEVRLEIVDRDLAGTWNTCGVASIDDMVRNAYYKTLVKQALAYRVVIGHRVVGSCAIRFTVIQDEEYNVGDVNYGVIEISYIAIDHRVQRKGIGKKVLDILIQEAAERAKSLPLRFLVLDALDDKIEWYKRSGFAQYYKIGDVTHPTCTPFRMDFIDSDLVEKYLGEIS